MALAHHNRHCQSLLSLSRLHLQLQPPRRHVQLTPFFFFTLTLTGISDPSPFIDSFTRPFFSTNQFRRIARALSYYASSSFLTYSSAALLDRSELCFHDDLVSYGSRVRLRTHRQTASLQSRVTVSHESPDHWNSELEYQSSPTKASVKLAEHLVRPFVPATHIGIVAAQVLDYTAPTTRPPFL